MSYSALFRPLSVADRSLFPKAIDLLNRTQGRNLFADNYLEIRTQDSKSLVVAAFLDAEIVGVGVTQIIDNFEYYRPFDSNIETELSTKRVGSFSTLAINESNQGQGLGQRLSMLRLDWLKDQGCQVVVGVSWVSGLSHTSNRVFEKMGFSAVKKVDHFYKESSIKHPFECPGCFKAPCTCSAILYRRTID